jgi:hypothetical protein
MDEEEDGDEDDEEDDEDDDEEDDPKVRKPQGFAYSCYNIK